MRRIILWFTLGGLAGTAIGFALGIFIFPFWFLDEPAREELSDAASQTVVAEGRFIHVNPFDPVHWGEGEVRIYRARDGTHTVHLERDFAVGPGPRFHVYLADRGEIASAGDFQASGLVDLGRLKAFRGSQNYAVPAEIDPTRYASVVIWCKEFDVLISPATLVKPPQGVASVR